MDLREGIGFRHLSFQEQQVYKAMLRAFSSKSLSFRCPLIGRNVDIMKVLHTALGDNPQVIYFDKTNIKYEERLLEKHIYLNRLYDNAEINRMNLALDTRVNSIASSVRAASDNKYIMLLKIYEIIQKIVYYDEDELNAVSNGLTLNPASHDAYGALINRLAVCDGFSAAFALLAQKLGFECMIVSGKSTCTSSSFSEHAWNIIKIDDKYYHIDITWDSRKFMDFNEMSFDYFCLGDNEIAQDHSWDRKNTPACTDYSMSYFHQNGLYINSLEHLAFCIKTLAGANSNVFRFKLAGNINLPDNEGDYLVQLILNEVVKPGMSKKASYVWNEKLRCFSARLT